MNSKILLIEDEDGLRQSLLMMLMAEGYEVVSAEDGSIGVDLAITELPDVIICDLIMPRLCGDRVLDILRNEPVTEQTPFICISSENQQTTPSPVKDLHQQNYLQKPFSRTDLLGAIHRHLLPMTALATG
ncbi:response regulator receiver protein [[Leptolyngbya] sp. PCC 7376]|uniref:response regulator n=1 Tax=[Leptolyngbya] sp. PCC 7376 TaxID=111781 RepID=UPI00029F0CBC|nr:response regulator [[Leptolyngbya] sp. PCC 7376]AFY37417.1 response regulator receiver protein [[Leptolyngbya] sp. PCC 7376]